MKRHEVRHGAAAERYSRAIWEERTVGGVPPSPGRLSGAHADCLLQRPAHDDRHSAAARGFYRQAHRVQKRLIVSRFLPAGCTANASGSSGGHSPTEGQPPDGGTSILARGNPAVGTTSDLGRV